MSSGAVAQPVCRRSERWAEVARLMWRKRRSGERDACRERRGNEGDLAKAKTDFGLVKKAADKVRAF